MPTTLITDSSHYTAVLDLAMKAKHSLLIGTADIKVLYVLQGKTENRFSGCWRSCSEKAWRYGSCMPRSRGRTSARTSIATRD